MKNEKQTCLRKTTVCFSCLRTRPTRAPCRQCNLIRSAVELLPVDILLVILEINEGKELFNIQI